MGRGSMGWLRGVEEMGGLVMGDVRWRSGSWFCASMGRWPSGKFVFGVLGDRGDVIWRSP